MAVSDPTPVYGLAGILGEDLIQGHMSETLVYPTLSVC